jgi:hypothetical protein
MSSTLLLSKQNVEKFWNNTRTVYYDVNIYNIALILRLCSRNNSDDILGSVVIDNKNMEVQETDKGR